MSLQAITNINVDFYDKKYILVNAKQYDKNSRFLSITCYNHGEIYPINAGEHSAFIRYKKSDGNSVFNFCEINRKGNVLVELTEQMLASDGICFADLVIVNKGSANVNADTGEIVAIDNASVLSTMTFCIDVSGTAVENSDIESSYEFDAFNKALEEYKANYKNVIESAKSWAVGGTGTREGEDTNSSMYYCELARKYAAGSSVIGVKGDNESTYRIGEINITADNVGAIPYANIATVNEVKGYLGIE